MLNQGISEMQFSDDGNVISVSDGEKIAKTKMVIASPAYLLASNQKDKVKQVGQTIRCICILGEQVAALKKNSSAQIIIPQRQTGRKSGKKPPTLKSPNPLRHLYYGCRS